VGDHASSEHSGKLSHSSARNLARHTVGHQGREGDKKVKLGHASTMETRISVNDWDGEVTAPEFGGKFPAKKPNTSMKYPGEARACFGAAMRKNPISGEMEGVKAEPFDYTGKTVIGPKKFAGLMVTEEKRVIGMGKQWKKGGYDVMYPDPAERKAALIKKINKADATISVCDIIHHVIEESKKIYAGTAEEDTFLIFHDGLSAWWESDAQAYIKDLGFGDRQLRCVGDTNLGSRYWGKVVGDSPELCRTLDSHGFADLKAGMFYHCSVTSVLDVDDPLRFSMGTPFEVRSCMFRVWQVEPSSARIIQDVGGFVRVLEKIIEAKGCVVPDEFLRSGRRSLRHDGKGECKTHARTRQRKATITARPLHPDARGAYQLLVTGKQPQQPGVEQGEDGMQLLLEAALAVEDLERDPDEGPEEEAEDEAQPEEVEDNIERLIPTAAVPL
jgi:hypothetical protein